jgi:hypothetical protein
MVFLCLAFVAALVSPVSFAQSVSGLTLLQPPASQVVGPYSNWFPSGQTGWVVRNPVVSSAVSGGAVDVVASGSARAAVGQMVVDIPATVTTRVAGSAVATAVGRAAVVARAFAGPVGIGLTAYSIYGLIKDSGVKVCPAPDFFCKPAPGETTPAAVDGGWYESIDNYYGGGTQAHGYAKTPQQVCDYFATTNRFSGPRPRTVVVLTPTTARCDAPAYNGLSPFTNTEAIKSIGTVKTCPTGYHLTFDDLTCEKDAPALVPATEADIAAAAGKSIGADTTGSKAKAGMDAVEDANARITAAGGTPVPVSTIVPSGSPVTLSAPQVTGPNTVVSKRDFTDANGVPQTETTQNQVTVTPQSQGSGTSTSIVYNIKNTTTITTTNNTVNNYNNPPTIVIKKDETDVKPAPTPSVPLPTDYNREATQQSILETLKTAFGPITATAPKGDDELQAIKAQNDKGVDAVAGITEASTGLAGWFPTIPTAKCSNPSVPSPITGDLVGVPICDKIGVFQTFISAVVCVLALFGCVREVQAALKA